MGIVNAWEVFLQNPFFGVGIGGVGPLIYLNALSSVADLGMYQLSLEMIEPFDPTNVVTEALSSLGIYGLCIFFAIGLFFFKIFLSALNNPLLTPRERKTTFSLLLSLIVMIICLQFNQGLFRSYIWAHMGISLGYVLQTQSLKAVKALSPRAERNPK